MVVTVLRDSIREYTQTNLEPGNCWQTCIACLLHVEPSELPAQELFDIEKKREDGSTEYGPPHYQNALQAYLREPHDLAYMQLYQPCELLKLLSVRAPGWHMMTGRTVRSETNGNKRHVVVARYGELVWDPHPSRAGLLDDINWAFLVPFPKSWRGKGFNAGPCVCPACAAKDPKS